MAKNENDPLGMLAGLKKMQKSGNAEKREAVLRERIKYIQKRVGELCVVDEQQQIDLLYYILKFVDDDECARVHDYAKRIVNEA